MSFLLHLSRKNQTAYIDIKLTAETASGFAGFAAPVIVKNQFKVLGTVNTDSQGLGSGQYSVVSGNTFNFTAQFSGNKFYDGVIAIVSGIH